MTNQKSLPPPKHNCDTCAWRYVHKDLYRCYVLGVYLMEIRQDCEHWHFQDDKAEQVQIAKIIYNSMERYCYELECRGIFRGNGKTLAKKLTIMATKAIWEEIRND